MTEPKFLCVNCKHDITAHEDKYGKCQKKGCKCLIFSKLWGGNGWMQP